METIETIKHVDHVNSPGGSVKGDTEVITSQLSKNGTQVYAKIKSSSPTKQIKPPHL